MSKQQQNLVLMTNLGWGEYRVRKLGKRLSANRKLLLAEALANPNSRVKLIEQIEPTPQLIKSLLGDEAYKTFLIERQVAQKRRKKRKMAAKRGWEKKKASPVRIRT